MDINRKHTEKGRLTQYAGKAKEAAPGCEKDRDTKYARESRKHLTVTCEWQFHRNEGCRSRPGQRIDLIHSPCRRPLVRGGSRAHVLTRKCISYHCYKTETQVYPHEAFPGASHVKKTTRPHLMGTFHVPRLGG